MPIDFPNSPTNGDTYSAGGKNWVYNGSAWTLQGVVPTIPNASVGASQLATDAVTNTKIASGAVTEAKIADSSITTAKIAAGAVVEADIANNAVTAGKLGTDVQLGYRNVIINGAMQVAQRGTSTASLTATSYNTADRWRLNMSGLGTWTQSVENDGPTGSGFRKSIKMLCTTADASPAANDFALIEQRIEGQNLQQFLKGTSSARQFAVSFWVKSNVTGTFILELVDNNNNRSVSASYAISSADAWEKKTIVFPADTSGAFNNDNETSLRVFFWLGAGSTWSSGTLQTEWVSRTSANDAVGQTNLASATNNYWQITGVQLEAGAVATPFEFEDHATTLAKCQRYYFLLATGASTTSFSMAANITATEMQGQIHFPVTMRAAPSLVASSGTNYYGFVRNSADDFFNSLTIAQAGTNGACVLNATEISGTAGHAGRLYTNNASASIAFNSEL